MLRLIADKLVKYLFSQVYFNGIIRSFIKSSPDEIEVAKDIYRPAMYWMHCQDRSWRYVFAPDITIFVYSKFLDNIEAFSANRELELNTVVKQQ